MAPCPACEHTNPDEAGSCARCGLALLALASQHGATPPTVQSIRRAVAAEAAFSTPLPAPMVEPILTPATTDVDPPASNPALTRSLHAISATAAEPPRTPAPPTKFEYSAPLPPLAPATLRDRPAASVVVTPAPAPPVKPPPVAFKLVVLRGQRVAAEYPIYEGRNTIGRFVDKPVDIDLVAQEPIEQVWASRLHAAIVLNQGVALVEDLNSLNGTWVNGARIHPGQLRQLKPNDVIQVGTVQMKLVGG